MIGQKRAHGIEAVNERQPEKLQCTVRRALSRKDSFRFIGLHRAHDSSAPFNRSHDLVATA